MSDEWVRSLCASVITESGSPRLFRIADLKQMEFMPNERFDDENHNIIFHINEDFPQEGDIALWKWKSAGANLKTYEIDKSITWIEYIKFGDVKRLADIKRKLVEGIENLSFNHNYLFEIEPMGDGASECVFFCGGDLMSSGSKFCPKENILSLNICTIYNSEIKTVDMGGVHVTYYLKQLSPFITKREPLFSPSAIVKRIILGRIENHTVSLELDEKGLISDFLSFIPDSDLIEDIAYQCNIDPERAKLCLENFMNSCENYLSCEDIDSRLLKRLINTDAETAQSFKDQAALAWEAENQEAMLSLEALKGDIARIEAERDAKQQALAPIEMRHLELEENANALQSEISKLKSEQDELNRQRQGLEKKISDLSGQYDEAIAIGEKINYMVKENISSAAGDIAKFFSDYAMYAPNASISHNEPTREKVLMGNAIAQNPKHIEGAQETLEALERNLSASGVSNARNSPLAAYLLASYLTRSPLIIAGFGSDAILSALSVTVSNKTAAIAYFAQQSGFEFLGGMGPNDVVGVFNALNNPYLACLLGSKASPRISLLAITIEELASKPNGIFNYALPLYTDPFMDSEPEGDLMGSIADLRYVELGREKALSLPPSTLGQTATNRAKRLLFAANSLSPVSEFDAYMLQTIPIMLACGKKEALWELIANSSCKEKETDFLLSVIGEAYD